ncbi:MAG TPA: NAD-dependent epimerase/dehydratase family protein [Candidatus Limnocylindrales bacterium]|nr:NAD-dependent epimerase/dehydratase family protein [Candidatus Limnocylindrales bacterium]
MTKEQTMHVVFGTGPVGLAVAKALVARGKSVRMVNRSGKAEAPSGVEVVAADAYQISQVAELTKDAAVVYQCAQPQYHEWAAKFPPLQAAILDGAAANGARLIVAENLYMYGAVDGPIHERLSYDAHTKKGRVRAAMTEALFAAHRAGKVQAASARASDFFGPSVLESAIGDRVIVPLLQGKAAQVGGRLDKPHTMTYIADFGEALVVLGERDEALGQAWHVPNAETLTQGAFVERLAAAAGVPAKMTAISPLMMRLAGLFIPGARETVEMMYEFTAPFVVDHSKYARAFGDAHTPLAVSLAATVAWYKEHLAAETEQGKLA